MKVLGINAVFHDPAAALVVDGEVVAAAEEERFSRRKHGHDNVPFAAWEVPQQAAAWCLTQAGLRPEDLDAVAYSYDPGLMPAYDSVVDDGWEGLRTLYAQRAPLFLRTALPGLDPAVVRYVPHHIAHAASAALAAPYPTSSVLVLDGRGETASHVAAAQRRRRPGGAGQPAAAALARPALRGGHRAPGLPPQQRRVQGHGARVVREAAVAQGVPRAGAGDG